MSDSDELLARCIAGERSAQLELFHTNRRRVHRTLYRILGTNAPMEDLLQEVLVSMFRSLPTFRGESSFGAWVDRIAVRHAYAYISKRPARKDAALDVVAEVASEEPSAERRVLAREAVRRLYAHLERLDPKLQIAFTLHVLDDRPLGEVAETMEATLFATKTRVWRARREIFDRARRDPVLAELVRELDASPTMTTRRGKTA